jgi:hypothetical protein
MGAASEGGTGMHGSRETLALRWRRTAALFAGLSLGAATPLFCQESVRGKEVHIAKRDFEIPVELKKAPDQIKQIHLWVSADQGKTWDLMRSAPPTRKSFIFKAPTDGEYQFTLAHEKLDGSKVPADVKGRPAGMRVIVDTTQPEINLRQIRSADKKEVGVSWTIEEPNPKLSTLTLKLKTSKDPTWHELKAPQTIEGKMEWPTDAGDDYVVQLSLEDRAGNQASKSLNVAGYPGEDAPRRNPEPIARMDSLDEPKRPSAKPVGDLDEMLEPPAPKLAGRSNSLDAPKALGMKAPPRIEDELAEPRTMARSRPLMQPASSMAMNEPKAPAPNVFDPSRIDMPPQRPEGAEDVIAHRGKTKPADDDGVRQVAHQVAKPVEEPKIKLVASPRFRMKYSMSGVGVSGVGAVDLYMTKDNGATWTKAGSDPDLESPIDVNLPGDGNYGLTVVVTNKGGSGQRPPRPGEQPQLRVDVDTEAPIATLKQVVSDPSSPRDSKTLSWETEDKHPAERSVDLYFSPDPERGWYKIAGGLPPSGVHSWKVPYGVPYQVYFMLIARDQANNVEKIYSQKPVAVDLSNPQGKIDDIAEVLPLKKDE